MDIELLDGLWEHHDGVWVAGDVFRGHEPYAVEELSTDIQNVDDVEEFLRNINGQYAIIVDRDQLIHLYADHIRSLPLFYSSQNQVVGDDFQQVRQKADESINPTRTEIKEYLATGIISGSNTTYETINQVQAGEYVTIHKADGEIRDRGRYYKYRDNPSEINSKNELYSRLDKVLHDSFKRLIKFADGDPIIVPLSAGYDSRLVALMLKKLDYEKVYAYHVVHSDTNSQITQSVADDLNIPLVKFENKFANIRDIYNSSRWNDLNQSISGYGTIAPRIGNAINMKQISQNEKLPDNAVITKGYHSAVASLVTPGILDKNDISNLDIIKQLWLDNFDMCQWSRRKYGGLFEDIVLERTIGTDISSVSDAIRLRELWHWQEKIPKRLIAHPKEYTCYGYRRWLPLLDIDYMTIWNLVPDEYRVDKKLHKEYIRTQYKEYCGRWVEPNKKSDIDQIILSKLEAAVRDTRIETSVRATYRKLQALQNSLSADTVYENNPQFGFVPKDVFCELYRGYERDHYFMALDRMDMLPKTSSKIETNGPLRRALTDPLSVSESVGDSQAMNYTDN